MIISITLRAFMYPSSSFWSMRPGRMSAGSRISGWFVVITTIRSGVSTTPSNTLSSPDRLSLSFLRADADETGPTIAGASAPPPPPPPLVIMLIIIAI